MADAVQPSGANPAVQETGGEKPVEGLPAAASEANGQVQEQQTEVSLSAEEERRRLEQSLRDKIRNEERLKLVRANEAERRRQEAERQRQQMMQMDDEDLGREARKKLLEQEQQQRAMHEASRATADMMTKVQEAILATIKDEKVRADLEQKAPTFASLEDFVSAVAEARSDTETERKLKAKEKEMREAVRNELKANQMETVAPQSGSGIPTAALDLNKLTPQQKIALAWNQGKRGG